LRYRRNHLGAVASSQETKGRATIRDWSKPDRPHYQMPDNDQLASVHEGFLNGGSIL
jgi:hypothetical protein